MAAVVPLDAKPIDDVRGTRRYKLHLAVIATQDALAGRWPRCGRGTDMDHEELTLNINGTRRTGVFPRGVRLLDALRRLGYTGTKEGCGEGECGACTVLLNGRTANACLVYAKQAVGRALVTVEGVGRGHPTSSTPSSARWWRPAACSAASARPGRRHRL